LEDLEIMPQGTGRPGGGNTTERQIIDFNEVRAQKLEEKRRKTERIFFKHLLSVYSVVGDGRKMAAIDIIDISEDGCSFQVPFNAERVWPNTADEIPLRLYFSQDTYLEIVAKIVNARPSIENGARYTRYGCQVDKTMSSYTAYQQFVKFMKLYSEHAHKDLGDVSVFYL
jgi:hypothetical protein